MGPSAGLLPRVQYGTGGRVFGLPQEDPAQGGLGKRFGPPPPPTHPPDEPSTYRVSLLWTSCNIYCLVKGFPWRSSIRSEIRFHFVHPQMQETLVVLEEGNHPLPGCLKCDMFVVWKVLNGKNQATEICARYAERWLKWLREEEARMRMAETFEADVRPLETVTSFKYLGRILVGKTLTGYKRGRPLPVLPMSRYLLPRVLPNNGVPRGIVPSY